jgi:hypothetical protein
MEEEKKVAIEFGERELRQTIAALAFCARTYEPRTLSVEKAVGQQFEKLAITLDLKYAKHFYPAIVAGSGPSSSAGSITTVAETQGSSS